MKAKLCLLISCIVLFSSCEKKDGIIRKQRVLITEPALTEMEVWLDPFEGTTECIPAFRGQWQDDKTYQMFAVDKYSHYGIHNFDWEEGFVFKLSINECQYENPPSDFLNRWYVLIKIISKTKGE